VGTRPPGIDQSYCMSVVAKVKTLANWGKTSKFKSIRCSNWDGPLVYSCFHGWKLDIERWFNELLGHDARVQVPRDPDRNMHPVPVGFGFQYDDQEITRLWVQTDPCHFGWAPARVSHGDAACAIELTSENMYCNGDIRNAKAFGEVVDTHIGDCQCGDAGTFRTRWTELDFFKVLTYSSAAWASASAVSNGAYALSPIAGDKTTPYVKCATGEFPKDEAMCDAGAECNIPLAALDVLYRPAVNFGIPGAGEIPQFVAWDYSDNGGDVRRAVDQCVTRWTAKHGWTQIANSVKSWGFTMMFKRPDDFKFVLHVVVFRGDDDRDDLVTAYPTLTATLDPNWFTREKATDMDAEYKGFLTRSVFGADPNPFTRNGTMWARSLEPLEPVDFKQKPRKAKKAQRLLRPVVH